MDNSELFAEIGRLTLQLRKAELQSHTLQAQLSDLEADGRIDHMGRPLPRPGHHEDCPHGQSGWKKCTCEDQKGRDARPIKTPEGKPLLPTMEFAEARRQDNMTRGQSECNFRRCTGRTTAMVIEALEFIKANTSDDSGVVIDVHNQGMKKHIEALLLHYAGELGIPIDALLRVTLRTLNEYCPQHAAAQLNLRDSALDDVAHNPVRDPNQDLKKGDHVRFEIEGIIKERQTVGSYTVYGKDFEPVQYAIKDSINGMTYYVGYHQITKVIGKKE